MVTLITCVVFWRYVDGITRSLEYNYCNFHLAFVNLAQRQKLSANFRIQLV